MKKIRIKLKEFFACIPLYVFNIFLGLLFLLTFPFQLLFRRGKNI